MSQSLFVNNCGTFKEPIDYSQSVGHRVFGGVVLRSFFLANVAGLAYFQMDLWCNNGRQNSHKS